MTRALGEIAFVDCEVDASGKVADIGAVLGSACFHSPSCRGLSDFVRNARFVCGHNILEHDLHFLPEDVFSSLPAIDTLWLSALLFPKKRLHKLLKNDHLLVDELNNPVSDALKARDLFCEELAFFNYLDPVVRETLLTLMRRVPQLSAWTHFWEGGDLQSDPEERIRLLLKGKICDHAPVGQMLRDNPLELSYSLCFILFGSEQCTLPAWVSHRLPLVEKLLQALRAHPCNDDSCRYCRSKLDVTAALKYWFGYERFRDYGGAPLQYQAAQAANLGKSLLAIFPTGGGKSLTFQLPALMAWSATRSLTVVISPLQSLMKDQVDHLATAGIDRAVTLNGLLSPLERQRAVQAVEEGSAALLYISPEQLRSNTVGRVLRMRRIERFVIDEAHCFSAWGHDFRVDYLFIAPFIEQLQKESGPDRHIPVSCFTATAKQKVIQDIRDYFARRLNLDLELFAARAERENLRYRVFHVEDEKEKYDKLREIIQTHPGQSIIVYVAATKKAESLAKKLTDDGFPALCYHGKLAANDKKENQDRFLSDDVRIMVATNAFGMGVDKSDVTLVVHYSISASLENYVQEAGRAGRNPTLSADCFVLFNESDLDRHFSLLTSSKLSLADIQQVWRAVKSFCRDSGREEFSASALQIAERAGWVLGDGCQKEDLETRVRAALNALEQAGYLERGNNAPRVFATGIRVNSLLEAEPVLSASELFDSEQDRVNAKRILQSLISQRSTYRSQQDNPESRTDYLADRLGLPMNSVVDLVGKMREAGILSGDSDIKASILFNRKKTQKALTQVLRLAELLTSSFFGDNRNIDLRAVCEKARMSGIEGDMRSVRSLLRFFAVRRLITSNRAQENGWVNVQPLVTENELQKFLQGLQAIAGFVFDELYTLADRQADTNEEKGVQSVAFSVVGLLGRYRKSLVQNAKITQRDIEDAVLFLADVGLMRFEGGFMVLYNALRVKRLRKDPKVQYKQGDYRQLNEYYQQKIQQIHIVGKYANLMLESAQKALEYVRDYFGMEYRDFVEKYFQRSERLRLDVGMTPRLYEKVFGGLSGKQRAVMESEAQHIVVIAGPGSGKTRVLVHKMTSLLLREDVKAEQLLMLTFSRAAAIEFKKRLIELIGEGAARFVQINTFHSYAFNLLGRRGSIEQSGDAVALAVEMIREGRVEPSLIAKTVLVLDEAQDMDAHEFDLVCALMEKNDTLRVIAVGDDDQNIFEFRGSSSRYLGRFLLDYEAQRFELLENYRSDRQIVALANAAARSIGGRLKEEDCSAVSAEEGIVTVTEHVRSEFVEAVVQEIHRDAPLGSAAVLTLSNEAAFDALYRLRALGHKARLIQSRKAVAALSLLECRSFLHLLGRAGPDMPAISRPFWDEAKTRLAQKFEQSAELANVLLLLERFESVSPAPWFVTDLTDFLAETPYEDFSADSQDTVVVSTVHKAKGREFDNVYLVLNHEGTMTDADRRTRYVGLTRAKHRLSVHYSGFAGQDFSRLPDLKISRDERIYPCSTELGLSLTLEDVWLGSFAAHKGYIFQKRICAGSPITLGKDGAIRDQTGELLGLLSRKFKEGTLGQLAQKGFVLDQAKVGLVVAWKNKTGQTEEESAVILPDLLFKKR